MVVFFEKMPQRYRIFNYETRGVTKNGKTGYIFNNNNVAMFHN